MKTGIRIFSLIICAAVFAGGLNCFAAEETDKQPVSEQQTVTGSVTYSEYLAANDGLPEPKQEIVIYGKDYSASGEDCAEVSGSLDGVESPLKTEPHDPLPHGRGADSLYAAYLLYDASGRRSGNKRTLGFRKNARNSA